jgi:hypothetical protein
VSRRHDRQRHNGGQLVQLGTLTSSSTSIPPPSPSTSRGPPPSGARSSPPPRAGASPRRRSRGSCRSEAAPGPPSRPRRCRRSHPGWVRLAGVAHREIRPINLIDVDDGGYVARSLGAWRACGKRRRPPPASKGGPVRGGQGLTKFGSVVLGAISSPTSPSRRSDHRAVRSVHQVLSAPQLRHRKWGPCASCSNTSTVGCPRRTRPPLCTLAEPQAAPSPLRALHSVHRPRNRYPSVSTYRTALRPCAERPRPRHSESPLWNSKQLLPR